MESCPQHLCSDPVPHPVGQWPHIAGEAMPVLVEKAIHDARAQRLIFALTLARNGKVTRARAAAAMNERRVHDEAAPPALADGEREIAIEAVVEAVRLVEAADRLHQVARQAQTDAVDDAHLFPRPPYRRAFGQTVDDRASDIATRAA